MDSFQAKIDWRRMRKREKKIIIPFCSVPTLCVIENSIKILKNSKKKKIYDYGSFQAKIGRKRMRNMENKNYRRVTENSQKNSKIIQKIKKYHYGFISSKKRLQKNENERK